MTDESAGKAPGGDAGTLLVGAEQVIEGWLSDLADSGSPLLDRGGAARLRRLCSQWIAHDGFQPGLDRLLRRCSLSDLRAAAAALRNRAQTALPADDPQRALARRLILKLSRTLREAARGTRPDDSPASSGGLSQALAAAVAAIQAATTPAGITRALLDGALRLCKASSAIWWEQQERSLLLPKAARGLPSSRLPQAIRLPAGFAKRAARQRQIIELSPTRPEQAPFLEPVGASRGLLLRARAGRRWTGALTIYDGNFDQQHMDLLLTLTQHAALALHAANLRDGPRELRQRHVRATADIGFALSSALNLDELLQVICRSATGLIGADCCYLFLTEDQGPLRLRACECAGRVCQQIDEASLLALADHVRTHPAAEFLWPGDRKLLASHTSAVRKVGVQSLMGLALSLRGQRVGSVLLLSPTKDAFALARRQLMTSFVAQAAVAIENLGLIEDMQRRLLEMADLTWVSTRVTSTLDAEKIVATIADAASKALDAPRVALFIARPDGRYAPVPGGQLAIPEKPEEPLPEGDHLGAEAVMTSAPQAVADARQEGLQDDPLVRWLGTRSLLCVPMATRQGLRGLLVIGGPQPRTFRAHEVALLSAYANQAALALQSALLYQDVVRHLDQLSNLFEVSQTLASSLDLSDTLDRVLSSASELLAAPVCSLMLLDQDTGELVIKAARGMTTNQALYSPLKSGEGLAGRAAQFQTPLLSADVSRDGRFKHRVHARDLGLRAAMAAPLTAHGRTVGVLNLYRRSSQHFTQDDKQLVMLLANSAAVAIENARLYQETRERGQFLSAMMGEINHRVRNTLQAIAGLFRMELEHPSPRSTEEALRRAMARLQSVATVHELMPGQELHFVDIKQAATRIAQLTRQASAPDRKIRTRVSGARITLPSQQATSVALILSELTDNAVRHGLSQHEDGLVTISLAEGGGNVVIEVRDNGVGLPEDFQLETMSGLGLKVVRGIVEEELGGTLDLEMKRGLTVRARFPKHR